VRCHARPLALIAPMSSSNAASIQKMCFRPVANIVLDDDPAADATLPMRSELPIDSGMLRIHLAELNHGNDEDVGGEDGDFGDFFTTDLPTEL